MKTRSDFVSNSSSCSFMIPTVKAGVNALKSVGGHVDYKVDDELRVSITVKYKNAKLVYEAIHSEPYKEPEPWWNRDTHKLVKYNPEDETWDECEISQLLLLDDSVLDAIERISIGCDDYNSGAKLILSLMYKFLKKRNIEVDNSDTEISWDDEEDLSDSFIINLARALEKE